VRLGGIILYGLMIIAVSHEGIHGFLKFQGKFAGLTVILNLKFLTAILNLKYLTI
jgi:hypothetical protein